MPLERAAEDRDDEVDETLQSGEEEPSVNEYKQERLARIAENNLRLEAVMAVANAL